MSLKSFTDAYIEAALWSTNDESTESGGHPLDKNYGPSDIDAETLAAMKRDCEKFYNAHEQRWDSLDGQQEGLTDERAGNRFWLNRNGHGTGFWDDDGLDEDNQRFLSAASQKFGEFNLYLYSPSHPDWTPDMDNVDDDGDEVEIKIGGSPLRPNLRRKKRGSKKRGGRRPNKKRGSRRAR